MPRLNEESSKLTELLSAETTVAELEKQGAFLEQGQYRIEGHTDEEEIW